jgi:outer membrane protein assembly factor BamB
MEEAMKSLSLCLAAILVSARLSATVKVVKFDQPKVGTSADVVAFDLTERKVLWKTRVGKSVNFVVETSAGILVGDDEGEVVLLNHTDGKASWKAFLGKDQIDHYHGESEEGFLVSSGDEKFWLVSKQGAILARW